MQLRDDIYSVVRSQKRKKKKRREHLVQWRKCLLVVRGYLLVKRRPLFIHFSLPTKQLSYVAKPKVGQHHHILHALMYYLILEVIS